MSSRRKKLSRTINIPVSASLDDVISALKSLALPDGDLLAPPPAQEHIFQAFVDIPQTNTTTFTTITATTTETMPSIIPQPHVSGINDKNSGTEQELDIDRHAKKKATSHSTSFCFIAL